MIERSIGLPDMQKDLGHLLPESMHASVLIVDDLVNVWSQHSHVVPALPCNTQHLPFLLFFFAFPHATCLDWYWPEDDNKWIKLGEGKEPEADNVLESLLGLLIPVSLEPSHPLQPACTGG